MLVVDRALKAGTIGGGRLEEQAIAGAAKWLANNNDQPLLRRFQLGPDLAQCCGGVVDVLFERVTHDDVEALRDRLNAGGPLKKTVDDRRLVEHLGPIATVVIFGGGHVGTALSQAMAVLPWRVIVVDPRPEWANRARFVPGVEVICASPVAMLGRWGWLGSEARSKLEAAGAGVGEVVPGPDASQTHAVVMTHDHGLDRDLADALLRVDQRSAFGPLRYVGVIGSKTKIAVLRRRLQDRGLDEARLDRLTAPIGLRVDGALIGGKLPGQIAIGVAAQLMQWQG